LPRKRLMLILGPSFRRNKRNEPLPALKRYDGLFYRVARKYLENVRNLDVIVMKDDLTLVDGEAPLAYSPPKGDKWSMQSLPKKLIDESRKRNQDYLDQKVRASRYTETFIAMGKKYAEALPNFSKYNVKVIFPTSGGPGPKAKALKEWLTES